MQQLFPPDLSDIANCSLSNAILEVGIDATIGELLLSLIAMSNEGIVCMIAFDGDMVVGCKLLECQFCLEGLNAYKFVIICMYWRPEKWSKKMMAGL